MNWHKVGATVFFISLLVTAFSVAYFFLFSLPKIELEKIALEKAQIAHTQKMESKKVYDRCDDEARQDSEKLLKAKSEIDASGYEYLNARGQGLIIKEDYNEYYKNCLIRYGLTQID